ncbi:PREDICTED: elongation of very long chain fatty acids protein AAEL008004-like, partial [Dinoponera quadriceps]|uniref:Elongation of very long chain fatty acids protein n=1 Tax=Dinoponera quadriceps TaxID=609295 RepID=A0A6P3YA39_DINQU
MSLIFTQALYLAWWKDYSFQCEPVDFSYTPKAFQVARVCWYYFLLKIFDWLDTIFFVLRKKQSHVSFLHVYHHCGMVVFSWIGVKYYPSGHGTFFGLINTFVHAIMYTYYLLSSMKINMISWKKHITQLQMIQFVIIACHMSQIFWTDCEYPRWIAVTCITQSVIFLVLFADFYYYAYVKPTNSATS